MALWTWLNGHVDTVKLVYELEEMKDKGLRGTNSDYEVVPKGRVVHGEVEPLTRFTWQYPL
jgi:hypothetical protein